MGGSDGGRRREDQLEVRAKHLSVAISEQEPKPILRHNHAKAKTLSRSSQTSLSKTTQDGQEVEGEKGRW